MEHPMHIPWTRSNKLRTTAPKLPLTSQPTRNPFEILKTVLVKALAPFPEAREVLCLALVEFDRQMAIPILGGPS
jgi:hypothetical protein